MRVLSAGWVCAGAAWLLVGCGGGGGGSTDFTGGPARPALDAGAAGPELVVAPSTVINTNPIRAGSGSTAALDPVLPPAGAATGTTGDPAVRVEPSGSTTPVTPVTPDTPAVTPVTPPVTPVTPPTTGGTTPVTPTTPPVGGQGGTTGSAGTGPAGTGPVVQGVGIDAPSGLQRSRVDRADDVSGAQVHVMYLVPADGEDRALDLTNKLQYSLQSGNRWLLAQTGQAIVYDTYRGQVDITFARLPRTEAQYAEFGLSRRTAIEADLRVSGLLDTSKIYMVFYDGAHDRACADAPFVTRRDATQDRVAVFYLRTRLPGRIPCSDNPSAASPTAPAAYFEHVAVHEVFHLLGVPHITARCDLMAGTWDGCGGELLADAGRSNYLRVGGNATVPYDTTASPYLTPPVLVAGGGGTSVGAAGTGPATGVALRLAMARLPR